MLLRNIVKKKIKGERNQRKFAKVECAKRNEAGRKKSEGKGEEKKNNKNKWVKRVMREVRGRKRDGETE